MQTQKSTTPAAPFAHVGAALAALAASPVVAAAAKAASPKARAALSAAGTQAVAIVAAACPKKPGSKAAARWALRVPGQTQAAYVAACVAAGHSRRNATADFAWDLRHGFVAKA